MRGHKKNDVLAYFFRNKKVTFEALKQNKILQ